MTEEVDFRDDWRVLRGGESRAPLEAITSSTVIPTVIYNLVVTYQVPTLSTDTVSINLVG